MLAALGIGAWALRIGLRMRGARVRRQARPKAWWHQHLRLGRIALWVGLLGLVLGPLTWVLLRGEPLLSSLHGRVGLIAAALAGFTGFLGRRVARGDRKRRPAHFAAALLAMLAGLVALLTGLELLP